MQAIHRLLALDAVVLQTPRGRHLSLPSDGVVVIDHLQRFQHVATLVRKTVVNLDELTARVGQAVGHDRFQLFGEIAGQAVAHLDWRRQGLGAKFQDIPQIFARMLSATKKQRNPAIVARGNHARREQAGAVRRLRFCDSLLERAFSHQGQDLDRRVVVVQHVPLGALPNQLLVGRRDLGKDGPQDIPLRRGWQRNPQIPLQPLQSVER